VIGVVRIVGAVSIRWLTAFIDRPAASFESSVRFWTATTASALSPARGDRAQFATLLPPDGDAYLRVQRVASGGGSHLDVHVDDIDAFTRRAVELGASNDGPSEGVNVLRSPAGLSWCVVGHDGASVRPDPLLLRSGAASLVDQLCIDIPAGCFAAECAFWSGLTGWELRTSSVRPEFTFLLRPAWSPLRLLLQRRDDVDGTAEAHLDIATDDVVGLVAHHATLGAEVVRAFDHWTTMRDPAGLPYCITRRDPRTGLLPPSG
jgi:hypothetical protein